MTTTSVRDHEAHERISRMETQQSEMVNAVTSLASSVKELTDEQRSFTAKYHEDQTIVLAKLGRAGSVPVTWVFTSLVAIITLLVTVTGAGIGYTNLALQPVREDAAANAMTIQEAKSDATRQSIEVRQELKDRHDDVVDRVMRIEDWIFNAHLK